MTTENIQANVDTVTARIAAAAERSGRTAGDITLVAVTKTHPLDVLAGAYQAGLRHFGENRTHEGVPKVAEFSAWLAEQPDAGPPPTWHFIGHIQSRQAGEVLDTFQLVHSLDSIKLAERLDRLARRDESPPVDVLLQCNVSGEASKYGFELSDWRSNEATLPAFIEGVEQIAALDCLNIRGLMTLAPWYDNPEDTRPVFRSLRELRDALAAKLPRLDWSQLSMGMTDDFEVAIEEGATLVRVGRALFGERQT